MTTSTPVLQIRSLTTHYGGVKALTDAGFSLMPGEHAAIVGDNGAGKSTFVRLITGVEQPNSGDILLDGKKVSFASPLDAREQGMETVYQTLALADLQQYLRQDKQVAIYKCPEYLLSLDSLPRNAVGKILKRELRQQARSLAPTEMAGAA
jgi:ABC-type sugar transport system ATPase subunit